MESNKKIGLTLICISAFFIGVLYISAAIYGSNSTSWSRDLYSDFISYIGFVPITLSILSFGVGIFLLVKTDTDKNKNKQITEKLKENMVFANEDKVKKIINDPFAEDHSKQRND